MAKAYRCDRCGQFYIANDYIDSYKPFYINNIIKCRMLDLCEECHNELQSWMNVYKYMEKEEKET